MRLRAAAGVLLLAGASAGEALKLEAALEADGAGIRVKVEGAFPAKARVTLRVLGDIESRSPFPLREAVLPCSVPGRVEAVVALGQAQRGLSGYRVKAEIVRDRQYPEVREALPEHAPAELRLSGDLASAARLRMVAEEEAFALDLLEEARAFIEGIPKAEQGTVEAWKAWREAPRARLEAGMKRGMADMSRIFPAVNSQFSHPFVRDLLFLEQEKHCYAAGISIKTQPSLFGGRGRVEAAELKPFARMLAEESRAARLASATALAAQVEAERALQQRAPDPERLEKRRAGWDAWLALWPANLERLPRGKEMGELGKALEAWIGTGEGKDGVSRALDALGP